jgi:lipid-A-disaccharide synthase
MAELRLFILAGEPSGDRLGADLVKRLRVEHRVALSGVGGAELEGEGLKSLYPMQDLAVMGFSDVLRRLPLLLWRARQTSRAILAQRPDVTVLIDSQVFSETVARQLRKAGYTGKIVLYVSPTVWAWKPERAPQMKPLYDEVLAVLPFEPAVMRRLDGPPTYYVGHPALGQNVFRPQQPERGPLLLLPGSRVGELRRHLALMGEIAVALETHPRVTGLVLPTPAHLEAQVFEAVNTWGVPVFVTTTAEGKRKAFDEAIVAAATVGTVTLELALSGVPMVISYACDRGQMARWRKYRPRFVGLPNILHGSALAPEHVSDAPSAAAVIDDLGALLDTPALAERQRAGFARVRAGMEKGAPEAPLVDPAERVLAQWDQRLATGT